MFRIYPDRFLLSGRNLLRIANRTPAIPHRCPSGTGPLPPGPPGPAPTELDPAIPPMLSGIILKLMAKNAPGADRRLAAGKRSPLPLHRPGPVHRPLRHHPAQTGPGPNRAAQPGIDRPQHHYRGRQPLSGFGPDMGHPEKGAGRTVGCARRGDLFHRQTCG